jgi:type III pantothenate kinase
VSARVVVDIGNTRIKWGLCEGEAIAAVTSLPPEDRAAWQRQLETWHVGPEYAWTISGVHPERRERFLAWLAPRSGEVRVLDSFRDLPLAVEVEQPDRVGIDRLLNAVAVNRRRSPTAAAAIVDAGSAVTVDYVDRRGTFRGGAIFPGLRLMAQALHDYTALLPVVEVRAALRPPGTSTIQAIQVGVYHAVLGGVECLLRGIRDDSGPLEVYLTGGDAPLLAERLVGSSTLWPEMTLAGILWGILPPNRDNRA